MIYLGRDRMVMNKKGFIGKLVIFILALIGAYFVLKYFGVF